MKAVDELMKQWVKECECPEADEVFSHIGSGKKLRSKLILNIAEHSSDSLRLCAVIELIQAASLLHDDVIDEAKVRRAKPSINALFGDKTAIMMGDILYAKGLFEATKLSPQVAQIVSNAVCKLSVGEMQDVFLAKNFNADRGLYERMIYNKTASLIEASARCAGILSGKDEEKLAQYGKNLGIAFQIIDDILDVTASDEVLGKPAFSDFCEGKTTLPYIILHERLMPTQKQKLRALWLMDLRDPSRAQEAAWLCEKFTHTGAIEESIKIAREYGKKALNAASNEALKRIAKEMIEREF